MKYREAARKLQNLGCVEMPRKAGGSHRKWHNPRANAYTTPPDWGSKDLKMGTLRGAVRQLGLDWGDFQSA
jgi:predicted RNA binding protein YcfA (HicA-like mRNA interferase family)